MAVARNILYQIFSLLYFWVGFGQKIPLEKVGLLNDQLKECSGIALLPSGHLAMVNDSGNPPEVFFTDLKGQILHRKRLSQITNTDWEEVTYAQGHLYIGDFGNNLNSRKNLIIYKFRIDKLDSLAYVGKINFSYAGQKGFPPAYDQRNYDLEAMVHLNDSIFIFTKNRTRPFSGYTYQYGMPNQPGTYSIAKLDSFKTGLGAEELFWIAAAALDQQSKTLALLGYDKLWTFTGYPGTRFFQGNSKAYSLGPVSQKEAIDFLGENKLIITDEKSILGGGHLYYGSLPIHPISQAISLKIKSKDFRDSIQVIFPENFEGKVLWEIFETDGTRVLAGNMVLPPRTSTLFIGAAELQPGGYVLNVIVNGRPHAFKMRKPHPLKSDN